MTPQQVPVGQRSLSVRPACQPGRDGDDDECVETAFQFLRTHRPRKVLGGVCDSLGNVYTVPSA